jgi:glycosyltransferase involved in cell wall biosynthesis
MVETKGIQTVIQALPKLSRYLDDLRLLIVGTGEERYVKALRPFEPLPVRLLGRVPFHEMRTLYAAADLVLMPSTCLENFPMVICESFMAGTPVLGSAIGGIPELIEEGATGSLFPTGDPNGLAERTIQHFALSACERRTMRQRCAQHARTNLTLDLHLDRLQAIYSEALES